jgi:eukaryotic-like serine/threonine-protein kinase
MEAARSTQLGKYQFVAEIARGGMGIVYLAVATGPARFSKLLVVKELKPELVEDPTFTEMFMEEARLAARLNHPNIVQTYEIGVEGKRHFMVMDYLDGIPLARILRKKSPAFTLKLHLRVICEMLQGLHYAHSLKDFDGTPLGMVHRDVSPQNVFITYDGQAKLVDFGIAKAFDSTVETRMGMLKGKPTYMAPEQLKGSADPRSDVYSAGVMIWEAIAGHRMWRGKGDVEVLSNLVQGVVPSLQEAVPDAPPELLRIVDRAMARNRDLRYASALDLQTDLEDYLKATGNVTIRDVGLAVAALFEKDREATRGTIEKHLARLKSGKGERVPSLRPPPMSSPPGATPSGDSFVPSGTRAALSSNSAAPAMDASNGSKRTFYAFLGVAAAVALVVMLFRSQKSPEAGSAPPVSTPPVAAAAATQAAEPLARVPLLPPAPVAPATETAPALATAALPAVQRPVVAAAVPQPHYTWAPKPVQQHTLITASHNSPPPAPKENVGPSTAAEPAVVEPDKGSGFLTIDTYPWTHVTMSGRLLGDTPLIHVPVPAGVHTISLDNPDENVHQTTVVTIKAGETIARRLAF